MSDSHLPINASRERTASTQSGYVMLVACLVLIAVILFCVVTLLPPPDNIFCPVVCFFLQSVHALLI